MAESKRDTKQIQVTVDTTPTESTVTWDGNEIRVWHRAITRGDRNSAVEEAALAYKRQHGEDASGILPSVFERELASRIITKWDIDGEVPFVWDNMPMDLGDQIAEAIGLNDALESFQVGESKEAVRAKNSSSGDGAAAARSS